jgi:anti-sigma regulatory factor (Ser/Thr protein kinase)
MQAEDGKRRERGRDRHGGNRLSLALSNDLNEIPRMGAAVEQFGADHRIDTATIDDINVALDELVTNVIRYAHADGGRHDILVELALDDAGRLTVEIADDGRPFDPFDRPPPDLDSPLEERPVGGLGIHFVRSLMDEASYRREGDTNRVRLVKQVGRASKPS